MMGQWLLTLMHHTRGLFLFQDPENPSNRNAPLLNNKTEESILLEVIYGYT